MIWPGPDRWQRLWEAASARGPSALWYEHLTRAYAEPQRYYHTRQHIAECLLEFDTARHLADQPEAVELALWFHDAVYDPKAADNEEKSAALARQCLSAGGVPQLAATVGELVMMTKSHRTESDGDGALIVDVDLSILGQSGPRFAEYEDQIRQEYEWVPKPIFNAKRGELLRGFLARNQIYGTRFFAAKYESQARRNLEGAIRKLGTTEC